MIFFNELTKTLDIPSFHVFNLSVNKIVTLLFENFDDFREYMYLSFIGQSLITYNSSTMGGKKKTTTHKPRVKENSKPSSSDKATRFLVEQTGGLGVPLTCLLDTKLQSVMLNTDELKTESCQGKLTGFVPILQDPDASGLDTQLLNILRRLEKRDSVTKQKALREFYELLKPESNKSECISVSTSSIVAVLPFWPRIYHRLSFDGDRKVRELVQTTMHALASRVGKDLGLYLKQVNVIIHKFVPFQCNL